MTKFTRFFSGVVIGKATKVFGCRTVAMISGSLLSCSLLVGSFAQNIVVVYILNGLLAGKYNDNKQFYLLIIKLFA